MFEATESYPLPNKDILSYLFDDAKYDQNRPVYVDAHNPDRSISCNQARRIIRHLIAGFQAAGVKPGDCVAIHSFNDIYYCMLVLAIIGSGAIFTGTNPTYTATELAHHIKKSRARYLISESAILEPLLEAAKRNKIPESNLWIFDPLSNETPKGRRSWRELLDHGEQDWVRFNDPKTASTTTAARLFSSGTTGLPKAVIITHQGLIGQHEMVYAADPRDYHISRIVATPIFHAAAAPASHVGALAGGDTVYMMRRFDLESYLKMNEEFQTTEIHVVPPMVVAILMSPLSHSRGFLKTAKYAICGAAPLDRSLQDRFLKLLSPGAGVNQVWGMTETSCIATRFKHTERDYTGSIGYPIPNIKLKLIDDDGKDISGYGIRGEICVLGPTVTPGYFENPKANADSFDAEGWYKTGDIGYCDAKTRKWYIVDRKKDLIKVSGFQVAPPELEAVLLSHPQIIDAAVIGIPAQGKQGEMPRAYVVRRAGKEGDALTEQAVKDYSGSRLAKFKALSGGVQFVDAIPKNASGKILKRVLREEAMKDIKAGKLSAKL